MPAVGGTMRCAGRTTA